MTIKKIDLNKEWLFDQYITKLRSQRDIADELGIHHCRIEYYLKKYGICLSPELKKLKWSNAHKGVKNHFFGKHLTPEHRAKQSLALRGRCPSRATIQAAADAKRGPKHPFWKGGRKTDTNGYIYILMPSHPHSNGGYVLEHRFIMERIIGRPLYSSEIVHHKDGDASNNIPGNLLLLRGRSDHAALHWRERRQLQCSP